MDTSNLIFIGSLRTQKELSPMILSPAIVTEVMHSIVYVWLILMQKRNKYMKLPVKMDDSSFVDKIFKEHKLKFIQNHSTTLFTQNVNTNETNTSIKARIAVSYFPSTMDKLRTIFKKHQIQFILKSDRKLKFQLPSTKDKTAEINKSGIYQISCGTKNCNQKYIRQTVRKLNTHFVEPITAFKNNNPYQCSIDFHMLKTKITQNRNNFHTHTHIQHQQLKTLGRSQR
jgi:hypothetical protein